MAALQTAYSLAKYGYANESASALIEAAEILAQTQTQPMGAKPEQGSGSADAAKKTPKPEFTAANLLADGKKHAAGDKTMLAWAAEVEKSLKVKTRGAVGGPRYQVDRVAADVISMPLRDITEVKKEKYLFVFNMQMQVTLKSGEAYTFMVYSRDKFIDALEKQMRFCASCA